MSKWIDDLRPEATGQTPRSRPVATEAAIQHAIRLALGCEPDLVLWRLNQGVASAGGRIRRYGLVNGAADLVGILAPAGRMFCLEVKSSRGMQSEEQRLFQTVVEGHGGFYRVVRSVEDARVALREARNER